MSKENSLSRRDFLKVGAVGLGSILSIDILPQQGGGLEGKTFWYDSVISSLETQSNIFALTVDDVADDTVLSSMLALFRERGIRATFFLVGSWAYWCENRRPGSIAQIALDGHSIGYHTMEHPNERILDMSVSDISNDFDTWWNLMNTDLLGPELTERFVKMYARAPSGIFSANFIRMCDQKHLSMIAWNRPVNDIENEIVINPGDIILTHAIQRDLEIIQDHLHPRYETPWPVSVDCFEDASVCPLATSRNQALMNKIIRMEEDENNEQ